MNSGRAEMFLYSEYLLKLDMPQPYLQLSWHNSDHMDEKQSYVTTDNKKTDNARNETSFEILLDQGLSKLTV